MLLDRDLGFSLGGFPLFVGEWREVRIFLGSVGCREEAVLVVQTDSEYH